MAGRGMVDHRIPVSEEFERTTGLDWSWPWSPGQHTPGAPSNGRPVAEPAHRTYHRHTAPYRMPPRRRRVMKSSAHVHA